MLNALSVQTGNYMIQGMFVQEGRTMMLSAENNLSSGLLIQVDRMNLPNKETWKLRLRNHTESVMIGRLLFTIRKRQANGPQTAYVSPCDRLVWHYSGSSVGISGCSLEQIGRVRMSVSVDRPGLEEEWLEDRLPYSPLASGDVCTLISCEVQIGPLQTSEGDVWLLEEEAESLLAASRLSAKNGLAFQKER